MNILRQIILALSISLLSQANDVFVHFSGHLKKPGIHKISDWSNLKDLEKACGGWTPFSSVKNLDLIKIIRFARREGLNGGANIKQKTSVIPMSKLPKKDGKYQFQKGDLIYIPARVINAK